MSSDAVKRAEAEDDREFEGLFARHRSLPTLLATLVLIGLGATLIALLSPRPRPEDFDDPAGWFDIEQTLVAAAADDAERVVLVLGDSVLRPGIMREAGLPAARESTPVAWARRVRRASVAFYDQSLDGLLPADMLSILSRLDELDPDGRVELVVELSPRYFATDYADSKNAHARPFFAREEADSEIARIEDQLGLVGHRLGMNDARRRLVPMLRRPEQELLTGPRRELTAIDGLRATRQFTGIEFTGRQHAALAALVDRVAERDRRSLFFCTPVNVSQLGGGDLAKPTIIAAREAFRSLVRDRLSARERPTWRHVFRNFDDAVFAPEDFIDHVHLRPEANAKLALRIMRALAIPTNESARPPEETGRSGRGGLAVGEALSNALGSAFLDADRLIVVGSDRQALLIDLDCGSMTALDFDLPIDLVTPRPFEVLFWQRKSGGSGLSLMSYLLGRDRLPRELPEPEGGWPFNEAPLFDAREESMIAISGGRLHLFDWTEPRLEGSLDLPPALAGKAPVIGRDHLYLCDARRDPEGRPHGRKEIQSIAFSDLRGGATDQVHLVARAGKKATVSEFQARFLEHCGLRQKPGLGLDLPFAGFGRVWFHDGALAIEGPAPHDSRQSTIWRLALATGVVQALVQPAADGFVVRPEDRGRILAERHLAYHPSSGRALIVRAGRLEVQETRLLHRSDWLYGTPPNMESDIVVANGLSQRHRNERSWRVGLFGSSLLGASYPDERPDPKRLMSSLSLTSALGADLDQLLGDSPFRAQALDFSQAQSDIVRSYATLLRVDPREIHVALIAIDSGSLRNPDDPRDPKLPRSAARFAAIERDLEGLPELDFVSGFRPRMKMKSGEPGDASEAAPEEQISRCIGEIIALCRARQIRPIFVDLAAAEEGVMIDPELDFVREALRAQGAEVIDARRVLASRQSGLPALAYFGDRHFRPGTIRLLAQLLAGELRSTLEDDLFQLAELDVAKARAQAAMPRFESVLPRRAIIDSSRAQHYGVAFQRCAVESRPGGPRLIYDLGLDDQETWTWRQALALLGLQGAPGLQAEGEVVIDLVRFKAYDEYGRGRGQTPELVARFLVSGKDIDLAFRTLNAALDAEAAPEWLRRP